MKTKSNKKPPKNDWNWNNFIIILIYLILTIYFGSKLFNHGTIVVGCPAPSDSTREIYVREISQ